MTIETISDTYLLDVRRPLQDLSIVFRGQNVQEHNLNLRIVTINVVNSGEVDILPTHYDLEDDWGVQFKDGEVIEARLVDTNSDYLRSKRIPQRFSVDTVVFPKIIFEQGIFFAVEVLLLHSKNESPSLSSVGKIAGVDDITVITRSLSRQEASFAAELFQGNALVQVVRILTYIAGSLAAILTIAMLLLAIIVSFDKLNSRNRKKRILEARAIRQLDQDEIRNLLVSHYEASGIAGLRKLQELVREPTRLRWVTPTGRWIVRDRHQFGNRETLRRSHASLTNLAKVRMLNKDKNNKAVIDPLFAEAIDNVVAELEK